MLGLFAGMAISTWMTNRGIPFAFALLATVATTLFALFIESVVSFAKYRSRLRSVTQDTPDADSRDLPERLAGVLDRCASPVAFAALVLAQRGCAGQVLMLADDPSLLPACAPLFEQPFEPLRLNEKDPGFHEFFQPVTTTALDKIKSEFRRSRPWARVGGAMLLPVAMVAAPITLLPG